MDIINQNQPQITLDKSTGVECSECGSVFFKQVNVIRHFSRILLGSTQDQVVPIPVFVCNDCNSPLKQYFPVGMNDLEERLGLNRV